MRWLLCAGKHAPENLIKLIIQVLPISFHFTVILHNILGKPHCGAEQVILVKVETNTATNSQLSGNKLAVNTTDN
jgi:hypothetical protein